ncbi:YybH family protein [Nakamurella alba]|nr:nuclear transport factor 2 family protein [Nakamurella alba]
MTVPIPEPSHQDCWMSRDRAVVGRAGAEKGRDGNRRGMDNKGMIDALVGRRAMAASRGDLDSMLIDVADDVVLFDVVVPLRHHGREAVRRRLAEWLGTYEGYPGWENVEVHISTGESVAFAHMISHVTGTLQTGAEVDMWFRTTVGLERRNGRWLIVHDHQSDPFNPGSGLAMTGLRPEPGAGTGVDR